MRWQIFALATLRSRAFKTNKVNNKLLRLLVTIRRYSHYSRPLALFVLSSTRYWRPFLELFVALVNTIKWSGNNYHFPCDEVKLVKKAYQSVKINGEKQGHQGRPETVTIFVIYFL